MRLWCAWAHQNWTTKHWKYVAWSNVFWFLLRHSDGGVKICHKQHGSILPCTNRSDWWWYKGVGAIFMAHFGPLNTSRELLKCNSLTDYCCWPCPFLCDQCVNVLMAVSRITHYTTKFKVVYLTWQWFEIASTVTRFKSSWAPLGSDGTGNSNNWRAADISAANVWFYVNMDQNLQERFPGYGWIYTFRN